MCARLMKETSDEWLQTLLEKNLIHYKGELPPFVKSFL